MVPQWSCETGATSQSYTASVDGNYHVETTDTNGCTGVSTPYSFLLSVSSAETIVPVLIHPNPTSGSFTLDAPTDGAMILTDVTGRQISNATLKRGPNVLAIPSGQSYGIYIVNFTSTDGSYRSTSRLFYAK